MKSKFIVAISATTTGLLLIICILIILNMKFTFDESPNIHPLIIYNDTEHMAGIANSVLEAYLAEAVPLGSSGKTGSDIEGFQMTNAKIISQGKNIYAVAIIFILSPDDANYFSFKNKGIVDKKQQLHCEWTFVIREVNEGQYLLVDTQTTKDFIVKMGISQNDVDRLLLLPTIEKTAYTVKNNNVYITYNNGANWSQVPTGNFALFAGKNSDGSAYSDMLFPASVCLIPQKAAFLFTSGEKDGKLQILLSNNSGKTWNIKLIDNKIPSGFNPCICFLDDGMLGYAAVQFHKSAGKAETNLYVTQDGGNTWSKMSQMTAYMVNDITFSNKKTGFLSFSNDRSSLYTQDGGSTWKELLLKLPLQYKDIFTNQLAPRFNGAHGEMDLNVGGNSGCSGEWETATFVSENAGLTWKFDKIQ